MLNVYFTHTHSYVITFTNIVSPANVLFITVDHTSLLLEMKSLNPKEKQDLDKQDSLEDQHRYI